MVDALALSALVVSRLCHDLISPVSAIANGLELAQEDDADLAAEALTLVTKSATQAGAKLQLFRLAFGAGGLSDSLSEADFRRCASDYLAHGKVMLNWPDTPPDSVKASAPLLRCTLLCVVLAAESLPRGGTVTVAPHHVTAQGSQIIWHGAVALENDVGIDQLDPKTVTSWIARHAAHQSGSDLKVTQDENMLHFRF